MLDITPTPRILRTLGEIPFRTWQCIAELIDNSIDAYLSDADGFETDRTIAVNWSNDSVGAKDRTIEITDAACGMSVDQLQDAVRAGYTSNDPFNNLGLFGVGFNIATARLGEETTIISTRRGDDEWVGLKINFQQLIDSKRFEAPIVRKAKSDINECGTKITIGGIKSGILNELSSKEADIRHHLEVVYAPLLSDRDITITVRNKQLRPHMHCVWSESRYVRYNNQNVPARINIDRVLGSALFDVAKNRYLTPDESEKYCEAQQRGESLPSNIVEREKRLTGWLGIQRYADPNDFGIDFIRNGRKILISDKSLFQYENPITLQKDLQYPLELGTSVGGRIVGELNVDYLIPTYQKNDFDRSDSSWIQTIEAVCGVGPFLPKSRKSLGFTEPNTAPLCLLVNAYRRVDKGTKCLFAPNDLAKQYATEFRKGTRDYIDDTKWWKAAQEEDQKAQTGGNRFTEVNTGDTPSDDINDYLGTNSSSLVTNGASNAGKNTTLSTSNYGGSSTATIASSENLETSDMDDLLRRSSQVQQLTGKNYRFGRGYPLNVRAYELKTGDIKYKGERRPCFFQSNGIDCDFVYDPWHPLLAQYPITPKMLLLQYLSEKLKARDGLTDIVSVYYDLVLATMDEARIDRQALQDRASSAFELLREKLAKALIGIAEEVVSCIHESTGEVEETVSNIIQSDPSLLYAFQEKTAAGFGAIEYVPPRTLYRLVDRFPYEVFDGKALASPYLNIKLPDENATKRAREDTKERVLSYMKDTLRVISGYSSQRSLKNELTRASFSVDFLIKELNT